MPVVRNNIFRAIKKTITTDQNLREVSFYSPSFNSAMRFVWAFVAVVAILGSVVAASAWQRKPVPGGVTEDIGPKRLLVCSTTQVADFARQIVGDRWIVKSVLAPGRIRIYMR